MSFDKEKNISTCSGSFLVSFKKTGMGPRYYLEIECEEVFIEFKPFTDRKLNLLMLWINAVPALIKNGLSNTTSGFKEWFRFGNFNFDDGFSRNLIELMQIALAQGFSNEVVTKLAEMLDKADSIAKYNVKGLPFGFSTVRIPLKSRLSSKIKSIK